MENTRLLLSQYTAGMRPVEDVYRSICEGTIRELRATRVGIWLFSADCTEITCQCVVDARYGVSFAPIVLKAGSFPSYLGEMKSTRIIRANNVHTHPVTAGLSESFFKPLQIESLLEFVLRIGDQPVAMLGCAQCGGPREWNAADEDLMHNMAVLLRISLLAQERKTRRRAA